VLLGHLAQDDANSEWTETAIASPDWAAVQSDLQVSQPSTNAPHAAELIVLVLIDNPLGHADRLPGRATARL